jgi:hypothetical protein
VQSAGRLRGALAVTGAVPPTIAHEVKDRKEKTEVNILGLKPSVATRPLGTTVNHPVLDETPFDAAVGMLFCLEARDAVNTGQLGRQGQRWVLINGHRCPDDRLLFDAFGF